MPAKKQSKSSSASSQRKKAKGKVVEAVGTARNKSDLGPKIEKAQSEAILEAIAEGIPADSPEIGKRMQAARERVKSESNA